MGEMDSSTGDKSMVRDEGAERRRLGRDEVMVVKTAVGLREVRVCSTSGRQDVTQHSPGRQAASEQSVSPQGAEGVAKGQTGQSKISGKFESFHN